MKDDEQSEPSFIPSENVLDQERITDEQLLAIGPVIIPKFRDLWLEDLNRLLEASKVAASNQDGESLRAVRRDLKDRECWISMWSARIAGLETFAVLLADLVVLESAFRNASDDILSALNGELPGQQNEGEQ